MTYETLLVEQRGAVTLVTLNRPQAMNSLNTQLRNELTALFPALDLREDVRVIERWTQTRDEMLAELGTLSSDTAWLTRVTEHLPAPWGQRAAAHTSVYKPLAHRQ